MAVHSRGVDPSEHRNQSRKVDFIRNTDHSVSNIHLNSIIHLLLLLALYEQKGQRIPT